MEILTTLFQIAVIIAFVLVVYYFGWVGFMWWMVAQLAIALLIGAGFLITNMMEA